MSGDPVEAIVIVPLSPKQSGSTTVNVNTGAGKTSKTNDSTSKQPKISALTHIVCWSVPLNVERLVIAPTLSIASDADI